ncbi:hypothetical protein TIFTF001_021853 [Ficus carica]|uniref:Gag-pol polyprotein n=1 Tax=Ficus carica TaxID=3494 RepID=A0AA88AIT7_FICCA|nr:hypothetical protein TIFTF001_021853 [Ficus carica]
MVRPRTRLNPVLQEPNLETVVVDLQRQLLEQQQETNRIWEQLARMNQMPCVNKVPPQNNLEPPVVPQMPEVNQGIPRNPEVPLAPAASVEVLATQQDEFNSMRQGSMTVLEAVKKFEQLARLCSELVPNETEKVRRMMNMFQTDITKQVSAGSNPPTLVADCISRAIRVKYWINQDKEGQTNNSAQNSKQFGKNKRKGNASNQGQQRNYPQKKNNQAQIEGPLIAQGRLEAPEPQARIYAYTKGDVEAGTSHVVTCQIFITTFDAIALFDYSATHSFVSKEFA